MSGLSITLAMGFCATSLFAQSTLRVPSQFPSIQHAIVAAAPNDTVLVAPGIYFEDLYFQFKDVVVRSEAGAAYTKIRGSGLAPVVTFSTNLTRATVLDGFRLTGGLRGIGVYRGADVTIRNNEIYGHDANGFGGGIVIDDSSPYLENNWVHHNRASTGGGISATGAFSPEFHGNRIEYNEATGSGGGLAWNNLATPVMIGNTIAHNKSRNDGGGFFAVNGAKAVIAQNLIVANQAGREGGGVSWASGQVWFYGNTIAENSAFAGSDFHSAGLSSFMSFENNLISSSTSAVGAFHVTWGVQSPPVFKHNDVWSRLGTAYSGGSFPATSADGNLSVDPEFVSVSSADYHLARSSKLIDAGIAQVQHQQIYDVYGDPRILDGNGNGSSLVDIGADEHSGVRPYGVGCQQIGTELPVAHWSGGMPRVGNAGFSVRVRQGRPNAAAFLLVGVSRSVFGALRLPFDLTLVGMTGCQLQTSVDATIVTTTDSAGSASQVIPIPNSAQFVGASFYAQWMVTAPSSGSLPDQMSAGIWTEIQ